MVETLIAGMTLAEKLAQLGCVWSTQLLEGEETMRGSHPTRPPR
ncbi:MAG: hypothetical protein M5U19_17000 [Microthrixaceae bacterium]|nr:hypothetical protein [Microthrixaceae bacterium]